MKFELRQRDRRAILGLAGAAAVYLLFTQLVFPGFDRIKESGAAASEKEDQLVKYRQALQRKGHYTQLLEQTRKNLAEAESRLIRGDNPSLASIELQNLVENAAKSVNLDFAQKSVLPAKKKDDYFNEITMSVTFDATPNQLTTFLANLRNSPKLVTVRNMQLAPTELATAAPKKGEFRKIVRVNLTIGAILAVPDKNG